MPGPVQSVERAGAMLKLLAVEVEPLSLGQVAAALGLAKGTTHGLLRTLHGLGFVEQEPRTGRYRLGPELLQLGSPNIDPNELRAHSLNWVDTLASRSEQAASIVAYRNGGVTVAHRVPGSGATLPGVSTGSTLPAHATALGKVLLAFDPGAARSIVGVVLESLTFRTITDRSRMLIELAEIRDRGFATSLEEAEPGVGEIAAPVRDGGGYVVAAVGIDGPIGSICDPRLHPRAALVDEVVEAAHAITRALSNGRLV